jgi:hypothetical protein
VHLRFEKIQAATSLDNDPAANAHQSPSFTPPSSEGYGVKARTPTETISVDSSRVSELKSAAQPDLTRDTCRELERTPGEAHAEYLNLNGQITAYLDEFVGKIVDATEGFKTLILPLLDQMQSLLSKRGSRRKLLDRAGAPQWGEWFEDFEKRLHLDITFRTIQRWLKRYRETENPSAPDVNVLAKESIRNIESKKQAEKRDYVVKERKQLNPAIRADFIRALKAEVERKLALIAKLEKGFIPPVTEMGKALPFTQAEIAKAAREQAAYWRKEGFPFHDKSETERGRELHLLLDFDHSNLINDGVVRQTMTGLGVAGSYFPHMMSVRSGKFRTPMEVFEDDSLFPQAIEGRIEAVGRLSLTANDIRKACMTFCGSHAVSNFRPSAAAAIFDKYLPETGGVVFDPSAGFGGRFLGALACRKVKRYIACDPATETFAGLRKMENELLPTARTLHRHMGIELWPCGSEDMRPNLQHSSVDCVLWSPPYFDTEKYSTEPTQSCVKFPTRESWLVGFVDETLDNIAHALKSEGVLAVNVANVPTFPDLEKAFLALAESKGWRLVETRQIELSPMWGTRSTPEYAPKLEPIFVFKEESMKVFREKTTKTIICADSLEWLPANRDQGSIITSLPDASEINIEDLNEYEKWVRRAATECFLSASENCPVIFIQTDRRKGGRQFSKANLLMNIAVEQGWFLLWHKIELTAEVGKSNLYRPTFRNMVCFGTGKMSAGQATPDVIPVSKRLYDMAFGFEAARVCVQFSQKFSNRVCDPFCGYGTTLHVAEELGMDSVGVDIDAECCGKVRNLIPRETSSEFAVSG